MIEFSSYCDLVRMLTVSVSLSIDKNESGDFDCDTIQWPTPDELVRWCSNTLVWIREEPVNEEADRSARLALILLGGWICLITDESVRELLAHDFWRSYAQASGVEGVA